MAPATNVPDPQLIVGKEPPDFQILLSNGSVTRLAEVMSPKRRTLLVFYTSWDDESLALRFFTYLLMPQVH